MKKFLLVLSLAGCLFAAAPVQAAGTGTDSEIADKLLLYIPNRLVDALDMFTVNLGIGPVIEAQLMATRAIWGGAGIGLSYKAYKAHNRQYGFGVEEGWYWSFIFVSDENYSVIDSTPLVKKYIENRSGFPTPDMRIYDSSKASATTGQSEDRWAAWLPEISTSIRSNGWTSRSDSSSSTSRVTTSPLTVSGKLR